MEHFTPSTASRPPVFVDQRTTARDVQAAIQFPVSGRLRCPDWKADVRAEVVNYHYRGACLRLADDAPVRFDDIEQQEIGFDFYLGRQCVKQGVPIRIAWKASTPSKMLGIEFLADASTRVERDRGYLCHPDIAPLVTSPDPLDANRRLYCKVIDISPSGLLLLTSLTNKHLFPGMRLENAQLAVPGEPPVPLSLSIHSVREAPREGCFHLGTVVHTAEQGYKPLVCRYLSTLSPDFLQDLQECPTLPAHPIRARRLKQGLTFRVVCSAAAYREVLRLRHHGYGAKGKLCHEATVDSQGEGLEHEGTILGAYLSGVLVASMELRFGDTQPSFRTFDLIPRDRLQAVHLPMTVEVNRLVVHPAMQGTDVVMGMVQKAHALVMAHGGKDILFVATDKLRPLYRKIGCIELGARVPHPHLHGEFLNAMMLTRDAFLDGRFLSPATWDLLYRTTHEYFQKICGDPDANALSDPA